MQAWDCRRVWRATKTLLEVFARHQGSREERTQCGERSLARGALGHSAKPPAETGGPLPARQAGQGCAAPTRRLSCSVWSPQPQSHPAWPGWQPDSA